VDVIDRLQKRAVRKGDLGTEEGLALFEEGMGRPFRLMAAASEIPGTSRATPSVSAAS
jgi:hypothetical protein